MNAVLNGGTDSPERFSIFLVMDLSFLLPVA